MTAFHPRFGKLVGVRNRCNYLAMGIAWDGCVPDAEATILSGSRHLPLHGLACPLDKLTATSVHRL